MDVGDFIFFFSNSESQDLGSAFFNAGKIHNLSIAWLHLPMDYDTIKLQVPDSLRSDHAPFWKIHIPALFISDTANFRNPYYHTPGDTISTLDFEFIKKVCQTTISTLYSLINK